MAETTPAVKEAKLFNDLFLRLFVFASLFLQVILIATGSRRKYSTKKRIAATLWLSYLSADYIATTALGFLSKSTEKHDDTRDAMMGFWAPFLLMHLGGPDTITAYALADNELWMRHGLTLLGQVCIAIYILYRSWTWTPINYLAIPIFLAGLIKYVERTLVLFFASRDQFRESMVTPPDPGPNYAKFANELVSKELEGYKVSLGTTIDIVSSHASSSLTDPAAQELIPDVETLHEAYYFFGTFKKLFADLILSFQDRETSLSYFKKLSWDKAFSIVEIELGLVYDLLYTKASILNTLYGFYLRLFSIFCIVVSFIAFVFIHLNDYPTASLRTEVIVSYFLLGGAILLEFYAILVILSSDRIMIWLSGDWTEVPENYTVLAICKIVSVLRYLKVVPAKKRWSNVMGQYNLINCCFEGRKKSKFHEFLEKKYFFWKNATVPNGLKTLIFYELLERANNNSMKLPSYWEDKLLVQETTNHFSADDQQVEFDQSLLLWHIATDICYYSDVGKTHKPNEKLLHEFISNDNVCSNNSVEFKREVCKLLSDYMMHLLIISPFMLPSGIGKIRFQDTHAEAVEFFEEKKLSEVDACEKLRQVNTRLAPSQVKGDRSKSLLFDACRLAKLLQNQEPGVKWKKVTEAWVDILTYAAARCSWSDHAEKLSQGGELLTHVWLLMAHFGMTDQFQISKGYIRAKLDLK